MRVSLLIPILIAITAFAISGNSADVPGRLEGVFLLVDGTAACASELELFRRLERHAPKVRRAERGERARQFRVEFLAQADFGVVARLHVLGLEGGETTRELPARSCDEAAEAAALVIALTLTPSESQSSLLLRAASPARPTASSSGRSGSSPPSAGPLATASHGAASPTATSPSATSPSAAPPSAASARPPAAAPLAQQSSHIAQQESVPSAAAESSAVAPVALSAAPTTAAATATTKWHPTLTVRATGKAGATPVPVAGLLGAIGLVPSPASGWVPSFELAFERTAVGRKDFGLGTGPVEIGVALTLARAEACAPRWGFADLHAAACVMGALGRVEAQATGEALGPMGRTGTAWWSGMGLFGRVQVAVPAGFRLEVGLGGIIPFWRYSVRMSEVSVATVGSIATSPFRADWVVLGAEIGFSWIRE